MFKLLSRTSSLGNVVLRLPAFLFHPLGILTSESGVQQHWVPLFFALVLHRIVSSIDADDDCLNLLYQAWHLGDGALADSKSSLLWALTIIENMGPSLVNLSKCEVFCGSDTTMVSDSMEASTLLTSISLVLLLVTISIVPNSLPLSRLRP